MSRFSIRQPVVHTPSFKEYKISGGELRRKYEALDIEVMCVSYSWYFHTDVEGWAKLLPNLVTKSNLYKEDRRTCVWYARKASVLCDELYLLNTLPETWGSMPLGYHAFDSFYTGDAIILFEPNEGFEDERGNYNDIWGVLDGDIIFNIGDNGYKPDKVFM